MRKINLVAIFVLAILLTSLATASMLIPADDNAKENAKAPENSPVISITPAGEWELERVDFIHYAKPTNPAKGSRTETCYKLMGVKWKTFPVTYTINPTNSLNISESFITSAVQTSAETWDAATSQELFSDAYVINYTAQYGTQNFQNAIAFGDYPDNNVIAVTSVWYTRVGKQIVEFDQLYNTRFDWGDATLNPLVMDLQNIATHELGHGVGLADIYSTTCTGVTMYGYSTEGETSKRTLEQPDVTGLQGMYGI
ncbi:MAG: matrixin family metalloprotease [Nanoarchaeota archaeon]|nr:matrixin family metalloprotease [Nanoarchaeota archaeon]